MYNIMYVCIILHIRYNLFLSLLTKRLLHDKNYFYDGKYMRNRNRTSEISYDTYPPCMDSCNYNLLQLGSIEKGEGLVGPVCRVRSAREWISSRSRREDVSIVHSNAKPTPILHGIIYRYIIYTALMCIFCLCMSHRIIDNLFFNY